MESLCRATCFAALLVGSSIALFTGAQADTLNFGPGDMPGSGFVNPPTGPNAGFITINWPAQSGPASLDALSGTFSTSAFSVSGLGSLSGSIPNFTASFPTAGDSLTGTVNITSGNANAGTLSGVLTVTAISGDPTFVNDFGGVAGMDNFTSTFAITSAPSGPIPGFGAFSVSALGNSSISPVPLPGAIYLFGSVLGGAFWLGRRKRSAVSTLGA